MAAPTPADLLRRSPLLAAERYEDSTSPYSRYETDDPEDSPAAFRAREKYREAQAAWADIAGEAVS